MKGVEVTIRNETKIHPLTGEPVTARHRATPSSIQNNPWLSALLWLGVGATSLGIILVIVGANAEPTWENPTAGLLASALGGGLAGFGVLAIVGFMTAKAVIWQQDAREDNS